jgi:muramoyltetrapeptide carboxypeptidase
MKLKKPRRRKLVVGFSDLTVVQTFLMQKWGWPVLHTTMVSGLAQQPLWYSDRLREVLFSARAQIQAELLPLNERAARAGLVRGSVVGGNMKLIQCLVKTPLHPRFHGKIVFFEDINERGYSLDRMLTHMTQVGLFKGVRAVVFGDFTQGLEPDGKSYVQTALQSFADRAAFPVLSGYPFGHGENRLPVPMGTKAQLRLGPRSSLDIAGPPAP